MFAVIPIKRLACAKTRLRSLLDGTQRSRFAALMAADVLAAANAASSITGVAVMTDDPAVVTLARSFGTEVLPEPPTASLSNIVGHAFTLLRERGVGDLLYLPADVPLVTSCGIDDLFRHRADGVSLVAARRDGGTNALLLSKGASPAFSFGPGSCHRHAVRARLAGNAVRIFEAAELENDIDTPEDFIAFGNTTGALLGSREFARRVLQSEPCNPQTAGLQT